MIYRSPFKDVAIPVVTLQDYLFENAAQWPNKAALIDGPTNRTLTYEQLQAAVIHTAAGLLKRGFKKGDVLAIYSPNLPEYAIAFLGTATVGGINTTINPLNTVKEIHSQLSNATAKFLVTIPPLVENAREAVKGTNVKEIFVFGESETATPFTSLMKPGLTPPSIDVNPCEDVVVLPYSSGTTGLPKGVMLTHYNLVSNIEQIHAVEKFSQRDTLIGILPFFHIYGMVVIMSGALRAGATIVTMPKFDLEQFLELLQTHGVTTAHLVPPIVLALAKHPIVDNYDLSKLESIVSGAAPLPEPVARTCASRNQIIMRQGYGLTETSPVTHASSRYREIKLTSVGPSLPNTEYRIVDISTTQDVPTGQSGEILIKGPQVMKGYLNNLEATRNMIDVNGWLHTGDVGYADEDGYLYIIDRVKELIKYKGFQVAPAELEGLLQSHEAVADAAVIPSPDDEAGEVPKAFVVLKAGSTATAEEIMLHVTEQVAPHKKIRRLEFIDLIPRAASGKILRRELVELERKKLSKIKPITA
jgi:acyl-CoA synthetase (AMP-forming)/AMP-acid ligase II